MLTRTARRLEKTTLLLSRQSLPRPARLSPSHYSTPSKPASAPATATAQLPAHHHDPPPSSSRTQGHAPMTNEFLSPFLARLEYTVLPAPLPIDEHASDPVFTSTRVQDQVAVMDACLFEQHNVPRAKELFDRLRQENPAILHINIYNNVLAGYIASARSGNPQQLQEWLQHAVKVFVEMESSIEGIEPDETTFAIMLLAAHAAQAGGYSSIISYKTVLASINRKNADLMAIVANTSIPEELTQEIIQSLSSVALQWKNIDAVNALARAASIARPSTIPEARATTKDGAVPFNIQSVRDHLAHVAYAKNILPDDLVARQRHLELSALDIAEQRLEAEVANLDALGIDNRFHDKGLQELMYEWHGKLTTHLAKLIRSIEEEESGGKFRLKKRTELAPYLTIVKPNRLSMITILEAMRLTGSGGIVSGMKATRAFISVGKAIEMEYKARVCKSHKISVPDVSHPDARKDIFTEFGYRNLQERRLAAAKQMTAGETWTAPWSQSTRAQIGAIMMDALREIAMIKRTSVNPQTKETVEEEHPVFVHSYEYNRGTRLGVFKVNPAVSERIAKDRLKGTIHPRHLPMLHPPRPWSGANDGAYHICKSQLMRFKDSVEQEKYLVEAVNEGKCELVMAGLDDLGKTPWRINRGIFDVVLQVWNSGERLGKLPPAVFEDPEPQQPDTADNDVRARSIWLQRHRQWAQNVASNHSDRCSTNYKIEIARAFIDDTIYFPHNMDFRGRAYPLPPHLNHIGDDLSRGLLRFAEGKPLGVRGLRWLKIHLANLCGFDKADFNEREAWVDERVEMIRDSAEKPLEGQGWWKNADDPWQCLAACMELTEALKLPDPTAFVSYLPVHQDGTCNGLQHYAAMGGDAQGAQQVNLAASDRPSDVYTFVGKRVEKIIQEDADKGNVYAQALIGKITRKVVKQTVMTTVYGVTFIGARDQLERQLKDRGDIPAEDCWNVAGYLAKRVLTCIGDTFHGARTIQSWLNLCARLIAKSISPERFLKATGRLTPKERKRGVAVGRFKKEQMTSVIWTTALGLPVVQPYRKTSRKQILTNIQSVFISDPNVPNEVNGVKQASAFPPNFVHSLDATHMLLSALDCNRRGLTFASVHDSYWTHACDIDEMSAVIRNTFIELHSTDVLGRLAREFEERYKGYLIPVLYLSSQPGLQNRLYEAGARIRCTREQAQVLAGLERLIEIVEEEGEAAGVVQNDLLVEKNEHGEVVAVDMNEGEEEGEMEEAAAEGAEGEGETGVKKRRARVDLVDKFLDISRLFPPLPEKGSFDVKEIRSSAYFFS